MGKRYLQEGNENLSFKFVCSKFKRFICSRIEIVAFVIFTFTFILLGVIRNKISLHDNFLPATKSERNFSTIFTKSFPPAIIFTHKISTLPRLKIFTYFFF
jgi:hypothetical protein